MRTEVGRRGGFGASHVVGSFRVVSNTCVVVTMAVLAFLFNACGRQETAPEASPPEILGLHFSEVASSSGLTYDGPSYAAAAADFDRDGWPDLAVSNHGRVQVFHNDADGTFSESGFEDIDREGDTHGVSWLDLDGDGWLDLLVSIGASRGRGKGANWLFRNQQGRLVADRDPDPVLEYAEGRGRCSCPMDVNHDGLIDVILMNAYQKDRPQRVAVSGSRGFRDAAQELGIADLPAQGLTVFVPNPGASAIAVTAPVAPREFRALRVAAHGPWTDITDEVGLRVGRSVAMAAPGDFDSDGDTDLFVVTGGGVPDGAKVTGTCLEVRLTQWPRETAKTVRFRTAGQLQVNLIVEGHVAPQRILLGRDRIPLSEAGWDGDPLSEILRFEPEGSEETGVYLWSDGAELILSFVGDSTLNEVSGTIESSSEIVLVEASNLREHLENPQTFMFENRDGHFVDVAAETGLDRVGIAVDGLFADLDNDGDQDLFLVTGGRPFDNPTDRLYENTGNGTFVDVSEHAGIAQVTRGRGATALSFDYDQDGDLDLFVTNGGGPRPNNAGPYLLWRNDTRGGDWASLDFDDGGAQTAVEPEWVEVVVGDRRTLISRVGSSGLFSVSKLPVHIGMGNAEQASLSYAWPGGEVQTTAILAGQRLVVKP